MRRARKSPQETHTIHGARGRIHPAHKRRANDYLHAPAAPESRRADWIEEVANAPNENAYIKIHV
jgi:hypothetical protein